MLSKLEYGVYTIGYDGGCADLTRIKQQERNNTDVQSLEQIHPAGVLVVNNDKPDSSEDVAGYTAEQHGNNVDDKLGAKTVSEKSDNDYCGYESDNVAAGWPDESGKSGFELRKYRQTNSSEQNVDQYACSAAF